MRCWGLAASAGMEAQVRALGEALKLQPDMKRVALKPAFGWLPNACFPGLLEGLVFPCMASGETLQEPWPELVISCGRRPAILAMGLKKRAGSGTRFLHIQDPQVDPKYFDLVVAMEHDKVEGANVIKTPFALHSITQAKLAQAKALFAGQFESCPSPRVAVLLGGSTNKYTLSESGIKEVVAELERLLEHIPGSLLITASRRTGERQTALLRAVFADNPRAWVYDGVSENPYLGLLALADAIVVSNDSVNMMSEARATGKPVYLLKLPGHTGTKPARFGDKLIAEGVARPIGESLDSWSYAVADDMGSLAAEVRRRLSLP